MKGNSIELSAQQQGVLQAGLQTHLFVDGPAGSGKTTAAVERLRFLIDSGVAAESVLVLVPQRSLGLPYRAVAQSTEFMAGGEPSILTLGGLAQRMIALFWPMLGSSAGFTHPNQPPQFLTLETAQYYLAQIVAPLLQKGYFESIIIDANRIFSQVLDNMNKAAVVGFPLDQIGTRLQSAWTGPAKQAVVYTQVQECALLFRRYCLENNLLDYSLQFEIFAKYLWPSALCQAYLKKTYRHLIYDNIEEDVPVAHDILASWLPDFESSLLIQDTEAGFRTFMGADRTSAGRLAAESKEVTHFEGSFVQSTGIQQFEAQLSHAIAQHESLKTDSDLSKSAFSIQPFRFYPQALGWISAKIEELIRAENVPAGEIVILTPFLSDSLRFAISEQLESHSIPFTTFRPSRSLQDEPAVKAMLTFAKLAHPQWGLKPTRHNLRYALLQTIPEADLIRTDLISQILYAPNKEEAKLSAFSQIRPEMQQRISYTVGNKFDELREWLENKADEPGEMLDTFFSRLFGELLSQPAFAFHQNYETASVISRLIESCRKFRAAVTAPTPAVHADIGKEYVQMVEQGVISAQYLSNWEEQSQRSGVLIAPAFTFLMSNTPAAYQFWLDIGSTGWWARLDQPLTQPYILSRNWASEQKWTSRNEVEVNQETLLRVTSGLLRRCSTHVDLISLGLNESGNEERGALLVAVQTVLRGMNPNLEKHHV